MVAENLKNSIIKKIYRDVDKKLPPADSQCSTTFRQYLLGGSVACGALSTGMVAGYSAILLPQLSADNADIAITREEGSWIASMAALPMMLGCLCSGYPMDRFGRKAATILFSVIFIIGWTVLGLAKDVIGLYVGRFLTGYAVGLLSPVCQVYIAETSEPKHRGILLAVSPLSVAMGILVAHFMGTFLHWKITAAISGIPPIFTIIILFFCYESPIWLLTHGKLEQADRAFTWYYGTSEKATLEWAAILARSKEAQTSDTTPPSTFKLMLRRSFIYPCLFLFAFFFIQQFSGINAIAFYSVTLLKTVIPSINEYLATIVIDFARVVISVIGTLLMRRCGRKTLSLISATGTAVSLLALTLYLALCPPMSIDMPPTNETMISSNATMLLQTPPVEGFHPINCIPLICLILYISFVSIGLVPIPWVLTGELFSKELRGIGSSITSSFGFIYFFLVVKTSPLMFDTMGHTGTFGFFGLVSLAGCVVVALFLPETKDKTLIEIEAFYDKKKARTIDEEMPRY